MNPPEVGSRFYRDKRSRGVMALTNDQTGHGGPREGWEGVGGPPLPSLLCPISPSREQRREPIRQLERRAGPSHHESRPGKIIRRV